MTINPRRANQRGSALLVVLVFAAIIAIMLYREVPVVAFEAQRQKEQLLMDRGNEYKRAIKLYVRKFQTFPPSLDALESTNRMRFLRFRYVDPYTGKDDWRLLHAGQGGVIIDSKIKLKAAGSNGAQGANGNTLGAPAAVTNPFANSFSGANNAADGSGAPGNNFPQRPPAIATNSGGGSGGNSDMIPGLPQDVPQQAADPQALAAALQNQAAQNPAAQNPPVPYPGYPGPPTGSMYGPTGNSGIPGPATNPMAYSSGPSAGMPGRFRGNQNPMGDSYQPGQFGSNMPSGVNNPQDPQSVMQALLNNQNPQPNPQSGQAGNGQNSSNSSSANGGSAFGSTPTANGTNATGMGTMSSNMGGGIAGVASKAPGKTIKVLNDQTERTLWEFVYDMQKEAQANAQGAGVGMNQSQSSSPGSSPSPVTFNQNNTQNNQNNNQNNQSNTFGNTFGSQPPAASNQ